ncbi:MAG: hypothetical protein IPG74_04065 [Flavobacteriales bacterium]|nr:hypothetical protein [Flavobacteriales bacterium]MBK9194298.1 hypothetical protein [Flavobacteriales bacterium]
MENKRSLNLPMLIIAIIIGSGLVDQFDIEKLSFEKPALAVVYMIGLAIAVYVLAAGFRKGR